MSMLDARMIGKLYLDQAGSNVKSFKNNMPGIDWAHGFLRHHKSSLTSRLCQNIHVVRSKVDSETVNKFFDNIATTLKDGEASNIINYDETNLSDDPGAGKFLFKRGIRYPERILNSTKSCTSIMFAGTAAGELLPLYVVCKSEGM